MPKPDMKTNISKNEDTPNNKKGIHPFFKTFKTAQPQPLSTKKPKQQKDKRFEELPMNF